MDIPKETLLKHTADAAIEQIASDYKKRKYHIVKPGKYKNVEADLILKKGKEIIVFEVKAGEWNAARRQAARRLRNRVVHEMGGKFNLVLVNLPEEPSIEIDGMKSVLLELLPKHFTDEFAKLATHIKVNEIADMKIEDLSVRRDEIEVKGSALVTLDLQNGSNGDLPKDEEKHSTESYPFHFHIQLGKSLQLKKVLCLALD